MLGYPTQILDAVHPGQVNCPFKLQVYVIFTSEEGTRRALATTRKLGQGLDTSVNLVVAQIVPYPLPLEEPDIAQAFTRRSLLALVASEESEVGVRVQLCRDRERAIREALPPKSIVVIGDRHRWWWPAEGKVLARRLQNDGHRVIFVDSRRSSLTSSVELSKHEHPDFINYVA